MQRHCWSYRSCARFMVCGQAMHSSKMCNPALCSTLCMLLCQRAWRTAVHLQHSKDPFPGLQVIEHGFHSLKAHITTFTSTSLTPDESHFDLDLTGAWSVMLEVFLALQSKLGTSAAPPPELVQMLTSYRDVTRALTE